MTTSGPPFGTHAHRRLPPASPAIPNWYDVRDVPNDVRPTVGKTKRKVSLGTAMYAVAVSEPFWVR